MFKVLIKNVAVEAVDIKSFELVPVDHANLPEFTAGAHIDVHLGPALVRQYSLCNDPRETERYIIAVKKEPASRGGSRTMHELKDGEILTISAPRNNFSLAADVGHSRLIAGGIGITPILAMARQLAASRASFDLSYFARSPEHAAFHGQLAETAVNGCITSHYLDDPTEIDRRLRESLAIRPERAHLYLCGPKSFMDLVLANARLVWPADAIHLEYFTIDAEALERPRQRFLLKLARRGATYEIPADKSIVEVLIEHGIAIETSCEQGVCGTCVTSVLEGVPDHRDMYLTDEEKQAGDRMMPCVSRSKGPILVIDL